MNEAQKEFDRLSGLPAVEHVEAVGLLLMGYLVDCAATGETPSRLVQQAVTRLSFIRLPAAPVEREGKDAPREETKETPWPGNR